MSEVEGEPLSEDPEEHEPTEPEDPEEFEPVDPDPEVLAGGGEYDEIADDEEEWVDQSAPGGQLGVEPGPEP